MSRKLIITADDYGYADHIDRGIIKAAKANCLTSVSCFSNIPKAKLEAKRLYLASVGVLSSWLRDRTAHVLVGGQWPKNQ